MCGFTVSSERWSYAGDLFVCPTGGDFPQHLDLAFGQRLVECMHSDLGGDLRHDLLAASR